MTESTTTAINRAVMQNNEPVETTAEHIKHRVEDAVDALRERTGRVGEQLTSMGASARESASEMASTTSRRAGDMMSQGRDRATEMTHRVEANIQDRPLGAVLGAVGLGFFVGYLCARR